ncbi:OVARIAN TUMOR DOMAIN-containing deubiquitinating enzyme 3 isoform X2 [Rhodamnia argentea]|uniref:Ubiquitin thioesterase OTU n=1 Tax=Rhodamnia argentea TaxID=178133 RepID=A0A8B8PSD4_9MYRT|nr:OVARIAN TUMOR DOMAIN-containing deubiquitinating enzyme 3 isoform X2 [Rhodamnia argentea]
MAKKPLNVAESILEHLRDGTAKFELLSSPGPSISAPHVPASPFELAGRSGHLCFARIASSVYGFVSAVAFDRGRASPAAKKVEHYSVQKVAGDGRCMFRALVKGMAFNKGIALNPREEREDADELRMAVKEIICDSSEERHQYEEALVAITVDESLKRYCQRIGRRDFWGGESELLVISKLCKQPIIVYIPEHEHTRGGWGSRFIPIAEYGSEFRKGSRKGKQREVVKLLYSGRNHYDLLV